MSWIPQSIPFLCLILLLVFASNNFPFRTFVTMIYWPSTELCWILLFHWIQLCLLLTLRKSIFFELPILIPLVLYLIRSMPAEVSLNCISRIRFKCSFFWPWENQYMVHQHSNLWFIALIPLALHSFLLWFAQFQQEAP